MNRSKLFVLALVFGLAGGLYAACIAGGNVCYDESGATVTNSFVGLKSFTIAQTKAIVGAPAGTMVYCSDCTGGSDRVFISTGGTGTDTFVRLSSGTVKP